MTIDNANRRLVILATIAASVLMLIFGLTNRALMARLYAPLNKAPTSSVVLEQIPLQIGGWIGQDIPVDETIIDATGTDAHISRQYSRRNSFESVLLYVASGVNARALMIHRPEVCYIGAGFTLMDRRSMELPLNDGTKLPCSVFQFSRGSLDPRKVTVLNYFIVDGQFCGDISLLRSKIWRGSGAVDYTAQVQIVASTETLTVDSATSLISAFAIDSASIITQLFEDPRND